ncbi:MAG: hypothetical protein KGQ49_05210, partial [Verrucomicrobia bacterium]|nr:hypothetical protein [Verrucomicrobiota bacterium]
KESLFLAASAIIAPLANGEDMKLVNTKTGFVVVEFKQGKAEFHDPFLEAEMKEGGILVPPAMAQAFQNKEFIFPEDPLFEKAFTEIYYPLCIANPSYQWQK